MPRPWSLRVSTLVFFLVSSFPAVFVFAQDEWEPDDTPAQATQLSSDLFLIHENHSIIPEGDEDWFTFTLTQDSTIESYTDGNQGIIPDRTLYDENLTEIVSATGYTGISEHLSSGIYYLKLAAPEGVETISHYLVTLSVYPVDNFEPNDTSSQATTIFSGTPQTHSLVPVGDVDWVTFTVAGDSAITLEVEGTTSDSRSHLNITLYDTSLSQLGFGFGFWAAPENHYARLTQGLGAGTYFAKLEHFNNTYVATPFSLTLTVTPMTVDAYEVDDSNVQATTLIPGVPQPNHSIYPDGDSDWVTFNLTADSNIVLETINTLPWNRPTITLYDDNLDFIASGDRIASHLIVGNYFAVATWPEGSSSYTIRLSASAGPPPDRKNFVFDRMWPTLQQPWFFNAPRGVAIDSNDNVYIADERLDAVYKYTTDGQLIASISIRSPRAIAVSNEEFIYIVNTGDTVKKYDVNGQFITSWTTHGILSPNANFLEGVAVSSNGDVFVSETRNHGIFRFSSDGEFLDDWGVGGSGDGEFIGPRGIAIDGDEYIYVADIDRVHKFTLEGTYVTTWGNSGRGDGQFSFATAVAIGQDGLIYVLETNGARVQVFTPDGTYLRQFPMVVQGTYFAIALDSSGMIYVGTELGSTVSKYSPDGSLLANWSAVGAEALRFSQPQDVAWHDGKVYVTEGWPNNRTQVLTEQGAFQEFLSAGGETKLIIDDLGNLYLAIGSQIRKYDSLGNLLDTFGSAQQGDADGQFQNIFSFAFDGAGNIYATDPHNQRVQKLAPDGSFITKWGSFGVAEGQFGRFGPGAITVDNDGIVYVMDQRDGRIQKFNSDGEFVAWWPTSIFWRRSSPDLEVDDQNNIYIPDMGNDRIKIFTSDGQEIGVVGGLGIAPGKLSEPIGLTVLPDGRMYVADKGNNRVQVFRNVVLASNSKAIIVAGGGGYTGNNLWDATQFCANFAYRSLTYQGFTKDSIFYLSSDLDLDLDGNGVPDDVDADATAENLMTAITEWAADADFLVVYLADHGGLDTFRIAPDETLDAADLDSWLTDVRPSINGPTVVVYDACQSGSFIDELEGPGRIVVTSSDAQESAYFLSTGTISFSNFFWTHVFNGFSVQESFDIAKAAIGQAIGFQTPQISDPDGIAASTFIGNGTTILGDRPEVVAVSDPLTIDDGTTFADFFAELQDEDGISRVWGVITPPDFEPLSPDNPIQNLPFFDLLPTEDPLHWEGSYNNFTTSGTYQIAIYARDQIGNTSIPKLTQVSVGNPLHRRAVLVGGGSGIDSYWPATESSLRLAYESLRFQGYSDDDIQFFSPVTFSVGVDGLNTLFNLEFALTDWAIDQTQDVVVYLVGNGIFGEFRLNNTETLFGEQLNLWLNDLQDTIPGVVTVLYDASASGSFLPSLVPLEGKQRIVIASAGSDQIACQAPQRSVSFSSYFWRRILNGATINQAFTHAAIAMEFTTGQRAELDDNGDGLFDSRVDGQLARRIRLGSGILLAGDDPLVGEVSPEQTLDGSPAALIWADNVTTTGSIESVYAVITLPETANKGVGCDGPAVDVVELRPVDGRF